MSDDCTCLFGHEPGEICENAYIEPEECRHWKATRSVPCKVCGKLTFSTSGRCLSHIRRHYDKLRLNVRKPDIKQVMKKIITWMLSSHAIGYVINSGASVSDT